MKTPIYVRDLTEEEQERLKTGLRSKERFELRRSQIVLASTAKRLRDESREHWAAMTRLCEM